MRGHPHDVTVTGPGGSPAFPSALCSPPRFPAAGTLVALGRRMQTRKGELPVVIAVSFLYGVWIALAVLTVVVMAKVMHD